MCGVARGNLGGAAFLGAAGWGNLGAAARGGVDAHEDGVAVLDAGGRRPLGAAMGQEECAVQGQEVQRRKLGMTRGGGQGRGRGAGLGSEPNGQDVAASAAQQTGVKKAAKRKEMLLTG